jgi:hypothetical protein
MEPREGNQVTGEQSPLMTRSLTLDQAAHIMDETARAAELGAPTRLPIDDVTHRPSPSAKRTPITTAAIGLALALFLQFTIRSVISTLMVVAFFAVIVAVDVLFWWPTTRHQQWLGIYEGGVVLAQVGHRPEAVGWDQIDDARTYSLSATTSGSDPGGKRGVQVQVDGRWFTLTHEDPRAQALGQMLMVEVTARLLVRIRQSVEYGQGTTYTTRAGVWFIDRHGLKGPDLEAGWADLDRVEPQGETWRVIPREPTSRPGTLRLGDAAHPKAFRMAIEHYIKRP